MKQAVILAAGEGQRLRPFTSTKPMAMLSVADKPVLAYVIEALVQNGIRNIVLVVGYKKEQIYNYLGSGERFNIELTYVIQEKQLGTAHALAKAKEVVANEFLVLPGNKLIEAATIAPLVQSQPPAVLIKRVDNPGRYSVVDLEDGLVKCIIERHQETHSSLINAGIYAFNRNIFSFIDPELGIPGALNNLIAEGNRLRAYETDNLWLDVVYPWDLLNLNAAIMHQITPGVGGTIEHGVSLSGLVSVGKDTIIRSNTYIVGPVVIGEGCDIGPNVCIMPSTSIAKNVVISPFTQIENSIIGEDVNIGPGSIIQDSVIDGGCIIGGHFTASSEETEIITDNKLHAVKMGAILGERCHLGHSITVQAGTIIGNDSRVKSLNLINEMLPDRSLVL